MNASNQFGAMKDRRSYITPNQANQLIRYFHNKAIENSHNLWNQYDHNLNKAYLLYTLWRTGRRVSEIVGMSNNRCPGLRPMDMDDEYQEITFHILKKNAVRKWTPRGTKKTPEKIAKQLLKKPPYTETIGYDDHYYNLMKQYVKKANIPLHERIFPYTRRWVNYFIERAAKDLNIHLGMKKYKDESGRVFLMRKRISAHCFRHGFAMNILKENRENPAALPMLQELLCHSSLNVTKTYLRFDQKDRIELLNKTFGVDKN